MTLQINHRLVLAACCLLCGPLATSSVSADLALRLQPLIDHHQGEVSVAIKHLATGESFSFQPDRPMPTASLIKFPLMIAAYDAIQRDKLTLGQRIVLQEADKVPGSGVLTKHITAGAEFSLNDAIRLMIVYSDNTATNLVIDQVGLGETAALMATLGCANTKLHSKVYRGDTTIFPDRSREFGLGSTTATDMIRLLELLHQRKLVSAAASDQMLEHLLACESRDKIPRLLPSRIKVAHKTGAISSVRCDAGIVQAPGGAFAICVLTRKNKDQRWTDDNAADLLCARVANEAYQHFAKTDQADTAATQSTLTIGASGQLVEALQRTLNERLVPAPALSVDGDFGPATQAAVVQFQQTTKLEPTGEVNAATWAALGPLRYQDDPVPAPEIVNHESIDKLPADSIVGLPFVTCKAWVIASADTGKVLWGDRQAEPLPMASTTKIMTAHLVLELAKQRPAVLDEIVTFSSRADETVGSTAGLRAGERLSVRELLFGLLLPSGNDASVALAEHFGHRLAGDEEQQDAYACFVAAMNRAAEALDLKQTRFQNTHGMSVPDHHASARDLAKLAWHALDNPVFAQYVSTLQHGTTVTGNSGYRRNLLWRNTNRLLKIKGYDGVKTGTTTAAGACLVSRGHYGDESLILVVLGSSSSDARYADIRNLYRWAWSQSATEAVPAAP